MNAPHRWVLLAAALALSTPAAAVTPGAVTGTAPARIDFPVLSRPATPSAHAPEAAMLAVATVGNRLVAAGERGIVLLSDDGGASWRQARVPVSVSLTALQFVDGRTGWAVGHLGVVLRTDDGGESWRLQLDGITAAERAAANPAGARSGQSLVKDGPDKPFLDLHFWNDRDGMVVGAYGLAFRTEDGGASWTSVMAALPNPDGLHLYGLRAGKGSNADDLYIVGEQGLMLRSTDRGRSFTPLDSPYPGSWFGLTVFDDGMHAGVWNKSASGAHEVRGRTLGIVGYGNIGTQLSVLAESLGMSVVFYDTAEKLALGNARRMHTLDELLDAADVVTLHVDGRPGNAGLFGAKQFARMRPGAIFLNLSRGFIVDLPALRDAVLSGQVSGAAVDVFPHEPKRNGDPFESELRGLPNVILTPHVGGSTEEAQENIGQFVSHKVRDYLATGSTTLSVNLPNVALDALPDVHRVAYLHRNVPGVLAAVNATLAEHGVNIEGQLLATRGEIGYVVTDASAAVTDDVVAALSARPESVRLRVLS